MKWKTSISVHKNGELYIRGYKLTELIATKTFPEVVFLLLAGKMPTGPEAELLGAMLVAACEHGVEAPSTFVARTTASTGASFTAALAGGILTIGKYHGGAIEALAELLQSGKNAATIVAELSAKGERLPGYGHKVYKDADPRTTALFERAKALGLLGKYAALAEELRQELQKKSGKLLPLNIDGAFAVLLSELGIQARMGNGLFVLARLPGLIAHVGEELEREKPYRRLEEGEVEYDGPEAE
ncbi:MAG: citryl-CoA lyase [Candidatus Harrisonbacteria bacterium]|nr:citryl-CoA lyase [Candidatus Harrisonbacteria bacterium]MBI3114617.1 citryl-CoA lyase [Candidatus Harrisonbacteria bacterium]